MKIHSCYINGYDMANNKFLTIKFMAKNTSSKNSQKLFRKIFCEKKVTTVFGHQTVVLS